MTTQRLRMAGFALAGLLVQAALPQLLAQHARPHPRAVRQQPPRKPQARDALALQVFLDRAGFSPGEIDGHSGSNTQKALDAYQKSHGGADQGELPALGGDESSALMRYTITAADVAGPFTPDIPTDLVEQATLPALDYRSPLEALSERFHASPDLLRSLNPDVEFTEGTEIQVPNVEPPPMPEPAPASSQPTSQTSPASQPKEAAAIDRVVVSASNGSLTAFGRDNRVVMFAPVTSGSEHDPLPIGRWKVTSIEQNPIFHYNPDLFWDADPSHSKAKIPPGPNGPVGTVWIGLDKPHYGLHGTAEPSTIGRTQSHGCVRLTNWDAERLASLVQVGTPVIFEQ